MIVKKNRDQQITQSSAFNLHDNILQQVYEKQFEHSIINFKQSQRVYDQILTQGKSLIDQQFNEKKKALNAQRKIHKSSLINRSHMMKAELKHKMCQQIFNTVLQQINQDIRSNQSQYYQILIKFIVQGALRMFQPKLHIRCLSKDIQIVKNVIQGSLQTFNHYMRQEIGRSYDISLDIDQLNMLKQRNLANEEFTKKQEDSQCIGGIILVDPTGNIIYKNTIDVRLNILKEVCLPMMRSQVWPNIKNSSK